MRRGNEINKTTPRRRGERIMAYESFIWGLFAWGMFQGMLLTIILQQIIKLFKHDTIQKGGELTNGIRPNKNRN